MYFGIQKYRQCAETSGHIAAFVSRVSAIFLSVQLDRFRAAERRSSVLARLFPSVFGIFKIGIGALPIYHYRWTLKADDLIAP